MNTKVVLVCAIIGLLLTGFSGCTQGPQQPAAPVDFYKSKTINLFTSGSPGGNDDLLSHIVADSLATDTGSAVKVTNKQGAGGMEGMNYVFKADADGLSLGNVAAAKFIANKIMADPTAEYEIEKFSYILSIGHEQMYFFVSPEGPYQSVSSLQSATKLKTGAGSPSGNISLGDLTVIKLLDLKATVVTGLTNESDRALAVKRGEIIGYCLPISGAKESLAAGLVKPLFVLATQRDSTMPDIPAITELASVAGDNLDLVKFWETSFVSSSIFIAPPGIPADRLAFLRSQAEKWVNNGDFRQQVDKAAGHAITQYDTGDQVAQNMLTLSKNLGNFQSVFADLVAKYRD